MKKLLLISLLLISLTTSLFGCKSNEDTSQPSNESTNQTLSAEKNLFDVEVTLPASFFEDKDISTIETDAKAQGIHDVKLNDDGSVSYKMDKTTHKKLLADLKVSIDEMISEMLADKESCPSFTEITYTDNVTEFNISVDESLFSPFEGFAVLGFYMIGNMYQAMDCVETAKINTTVNFINKDTKEIIESGNSADLGTTE